MTFISALVMYHYQCGPGIHPSMLPFLFNTSFKLEHKLLTNCINHNVNIRLFLDVSLIAAFIIQHFNKYLIKKEIFFFLMRYLLKGTWTQHLW